MKKLVNTVKYSLLSLLFLINFSCDEQKFLEEIPLDFFSPENSFQNLSDFERSITGLYAKVREIHYGVYDQNRFAHFYGTDVAVNGRGDNRWFADYNIQLQTTNSWVSFHWDSWYKVISDANAIISRADDSKLSDKQKSVVVAEAKFFRAFAYRYLVYLYGGVPLIIEEVTSPKNDFTRASKEDILNQIVQDATEAATNLPSINEVADGKVSNIVAKHLLAETYISLKKYDEAITAASSVIDDPNTSLMTSRFGKKANQNPFDKFLKFTKPGDVYWDLFQQGNQNRSSGNKEALWVAQMEVNTIGGLLTTTSYTNSLERHAVPAANGLLLDPDRKQGMLGFGCSDYNTGGRGISILKNTDYYLYTLWESDWDNDIRNAPHNIVRDIKYNNPASAWYDSSAVKYLSPTIQSQNWRWYPYPSKITTPGDHPDELFESKENNTLKAIAGSTYRDMYYLRLAETYLLRAEAYLGKNDIINAAKDINAVRERSNAKPVNPSDVTLDYILDERARELIYEEQRRITLQRTGKLVERVRKYNDLSRNYDIKDYHGLWPIPFAEIEANKNAVIEQNPGYN